MTLDLYRVGVPSIGESYRNRWTWHRSTGGLGTGVYAFRSLGAAQENIDRHHGGGEPIVLEDALESPIQPTTEKGTRALNDLSRRADLAMDMIDYGYVTFEEISERPGAYPLSMSSFYSGEERVGNGKTMTKDAFTVLLNTPELRADYGMDDEQFCRDLLRAAQTARERCPGDADPGCTQPINVLLADEYDGVAPYSGAGGDTGQYGCVIFKEKVDRCVGRSLGFSDEVPADQLNACFAGVTA